MKILPNGENIAKLPNHSNSFDDVVKSWMESPKHRKNILGEYKYGGVATCLDKKGSRFWVQVFGNQNSGNDSEKDSEDPNSGYPNRNNDTEEDNLRNRKNNRSKNSPKGRKSRYSIPSSKSKVAFEDAELSTEEMPMSIPRPKRSKRDVSSSTPCSVSLPPPLLDKITNFEIPKLTTFVSTQIIYVFSTPSSFKTIKENCSSAQESISIQSSSDSIRKSSTSPLISSVESRITSYLTITKNEIKTVSEKNTTTITRTEYKTVSPSVSIVSTTLVVTEISSPQIISQIDHSTTTQTITSTVEITKNVTMEPVRRSTRKPVPTKTRSRETQKSREPKRKYKTVPMIISTVMMVSDQEDSQDQESNERKENRNPKPYMNENRYDDTDNEADDQEDEQYDTVQPSRTVKRAKDKATYSNQNSKPEKRRNQPNTRQKNTVMNNRNIQRDIKQSLEDMISSGLDISVNIKPKKKGRFQI